MLIILGFTYYFSSSHIRRLFYIFDFLFIFLLVSLFYIFCFYCLTCFKSNINYYFCQYCLCFNRDIFIKKLRIFLRSFLLNHLLWNHIPTCFLYRNDPSLIRSFLKKSRYFHPELLRSRRKQSFLPLPTLPPKPHSSASHDKLLTLPSKPST